MLGTLPKEEKLRWSKWVPAMTHAYNCTKCQVTGFSPYFLMFRCEPLLPIDIEYGVMAPYISVKDHGSFVKRLQKRL